ncbi:hypothetical protein BVC80_8897g5 [Macleaya cordata]|uniref:Uncharacterized protein n=1 Tax=Macleaya cordata TaxID=56857 RepID=A0A200Q3U7_MACCD|nr:hypothetical protein BVC80_8897g5 [Macleaya cordata]
MPLLWKKSKIGRISRFVSDLKSSKHGESLVVETGFPTSLVDLMIKNRDRLKKPSKKKNKQSSLEMISSNSLIHPPPPPCPLLPQLPELTSFPFLPHLSPSSNSTMLMVPSSPSTIKTVMKSHFSSCSDEKEEIFLKVSATNRAFMLILKLLFLLILAIGTKKIAIVITVSAFVLLLLEFASKSLSCYLKPCPDAKESFNSVVDRVLSSVHPKLDETETFKDNRRLIEQEEETLVGENCGFIEQDNNNENHNININGAMIIAEDLTMNEEIQIEPGFDSLHCRCRWGFIESDQKKKMSSSSSTKDEELIEDENIKSSKKKGSSKFKSNMLKKFVPKKFRVSKNKKRNSEECYLDWNSEFVSYCIGEEEKLNRIWEQMQERSQPGVYIN